MKKQYTSPKMQIMDIEHGGNLLSGSPENPWWVPPEEKEGCDTPWWCK